MPARTGVSTPNLPSSSATTRSRPLSSAPAGRASPAIISAAHTHPDPAQLDAAILRTLEEHGVDLVILAGYMKLLGPQTLARYRGRILNIHPALLPKFGGKGLYGRKVHEAVLAAGERVTGVTIHLVDESYDRRADRRAVRSAGPRGDTADSLARASWNASTSFSWRRCRRSSRAR